MDLMAVKRSRTLLREIESPTDDLVTEGIFYVMLFGKRPTWERVAKSMLELDRRLSREQADDRIAAGIKSDRIRLGFCEKANDHIVFPVSAQDWWKVTLRYLINYSEKMVENNTPMDRHTKVLAEVCRPYLAEMLTTNRLPDELPIPEDD